MTRRAFTLIEVLAATVLSAAIAIMAGGWLLSLHRSHTDAIRHAADATAAMLVVTQVRDDLIHATTLPVLDPGASTTRGDLQFLVAGRCGSERQEVRWRVADRAVERSTRPPEGGRWTTVQVATGIDILRCDRDRANRLHIQVDAGRTTIHLPITTMVPDAP